jgi:phage-related protein
LLPPPGRGRVGEGVDSRHACAATAIAAPGGGKHHDAKVLTGFGSAGVLEVVEDDRGNTYRAVYTVKFAGWVYVLHCFQKKSKSGIKTPKEDMDLIRARLKSAKQDFEAWQAITGAA